MDDADLFADLEELGQDEESEQENDEMAEDNDEMKESIASFSKTFNSQQLAQLLKQIDGFNESERSEYQNSGPIEQDPEYALVVQSNLLSVELDYEITLVTKVSLIKKRIKDIYANHFPELESLILNPIEYAQVVKMIGNETDMTTLDLKSILPSATVMVINVTATTTNGRLLTTDELADLYQACDLIQEMDVARKKMLEYVASRMSIIAPNLTVLLGSTTAAKVMALAGGLTALSKIPSCNLLVVGVQRKAMLGLSRVSTNKHEGVIFECELIQKCPKHIHRKAGRLVAAKCALACRVDLSREYPDGRMGQEFRQDIQKKIDLLIEPPPAKKTKALPLPIEFKKRRGGKRARRDKERMAGSELQKASNRMAFGEAEEEVIGITGESIGLGLVGGRSGKLRLKPKDPKFKVPVSKKHKAMLSVNDSGFTTSISMTPIKGIELGNPELVKKEANEKYFSFSKK